MMLSISSCDCWSFVCLLWKNVYSSLPIFQLDCFCFFFMLICMSCLYILDISSLSLISLENIFSHSVRCLFVLSIVSFVVQKLLSLIRSHLLFFLKKYFFKNLLIFSGCAESLLLCTSVL